MTDPSEPTGAVDPTGTGLQQGHAKQTGARSDDIGLVIAGKYTLVELIGEGGMGSVYRAQQTEPVKREVAVKLIKSGSESRSVLARFDAERQALALMDHPHIARVYDGGTTPSGMPFFVMELVRGVPLTTFCDRRRLTVDARLELFVAICQAVQHAHQKGIIHRDLKPSNVLVTEIDGKPVPKVIDFGLAKATEQKLTDLSFADTGLIVGTASYMSPEQADPTMHDIDTRTDVYALGVILYELLTGSPPIDAREFKRGAILEVLRMVREQDPPRPSTRLSKSAALPSIAANRSIEPAQLRSLLRGELDWVVMKALEKDRTRRYETVNGLARDVQRYLADEVVEARPPSRGYRLSKFVKRNKGQVAAGLLVFLALLAGVIGTSLGLVEARHQRDEANIARGEAVAAAHATELARQAEEEQRLAAEEANQRAIEALKSFTGEFMGKFLGSRQNLTDLEKSVLESARKQWEVFAQSKGNSPDAREMRGEGAAELALLQSRLGLSAEAVASDRLALEVRSALAKDFPKEPRYRLKQAMSHHNMGVSLRIAGQRAEAEAHFKDAVNILGRLSAEYPDSQIYRSKLVDSLTSLGNVARARQQWAEAEEYYRAALAEINKLVSLEPENVDYLTGLANGHWGLAVTLRQLEQIDDSEKEYRRAIAIYEKLARVKGADEFYRQQVANLCRELGLLLYDDGKHEAGAALFPRAIEILDQLAAEFPSMPVYRMDLARCRRDYAKGLDFVKKPLEAAAEFQKAMALGEKLVNDHPAVLPYRADLGLTYAYYADLIRDGPMPAQSLDWYARAISVLTAAHQQDRQVFLTRNALIKCHGSLAEAYSKLGKHAEAIRELDRALEIGSSPKLPMLRGQRAYTRACMGQLAEAIAELKELTKSNPKESSIWYHLACVYALASLKDAARRVEYQDLAMEQLRQAARAGFEDHEEMATNPDLQPLRERPDFKQLLTELRNKTTPPSPP